MQAFYKYRVDEKYGRISPAISEGNPMKNCNGNEVAGTRCNQWGILILIRADGGRLVSRTSGISDLIGIG